MDEVVVWAWLEEEAGLTSLTADLLSPLPCEVLAPEAENPGFVSAGILGDMMEVVVVGWYSVYL